MSNAAINFHVKAFVQVFIHLGSGCTVRVFLTGGRKTFPKVLQPTKEWGPIYFRSLQNLILSVLLNLAILYVCTEVAYCGFYILLFEE